VLQITNRKPHTESRTHWPAADIAAKPTPVPLQKHLPGGCNIDIPSNCHQRRRRAYCFASR